MHLRVAVALIVLLAACGRDGGPATAATATPATAPTGQPAVDSEPFPRFENLSGLRVLPPRWLGGDTARFVVEAGPPVAGEDAAIEGALTITVPGQADIVVPVRLQRSERRRKSGSGARWRGQAEVSSATWADGMASARCSVGATTSAPAAFRVVRAALAAVQSDREELAAWIDEANRMEPIWGKLPRWSALDAALRQPAAPYAGLTGFVLRAYRSAHLDRWQPYTLAVPPTLELSKPVPLLIVLHGSGGDFRNIISDQAAGQRFDDHPMLVANAGAFRYREYRSVAAQDVVGVIDDVCAKYQVDRSRIYLQGISLGGRGTLEVAALMPDRFAAISTQGTYGLIDRFVDPVLAARTDPVALGLAARADIRTWLTNLRNTPTEAIIGLRDDTTPAYNGLLFAHMLREQGGIAVERTFPRGHDLTMPEYDWATTRAWMLEHRRDPSPAMVRHRVACLRYGRNAWVDVRALEDYAGIGDVRAGLVAKGSATAAMVDVVNIASIELSPPPPVSEIAIRHAGVITTLPMPPSGRLRLSLGADGVRIAEDAAVDPLVKRPGRSGPLWDAWSDPVLYVYDAVPGDLGKRLRTAAEDSATWDLTSGQRRLPVVAADAVTDEQRRTRNLVVFTADPAACPLLAGVDVPTLPATLDGRVAVMLRPAPWHDDRSVVVVIHRAKRAVSLNEFGIWDECLHGDWVVADALPIAEPAQPGGRTDPHPGVDAVAAGVFDAHWRPAASTTGPFAGEAFLGPGAH